MKRTAELSLLDTTSFSRPLHGLWFKSSFDPSAEALGYFHSVRFADVENDFCSKDCRIYKHSAPMELKSILVSGSRAVSAVD